MNFTVERARNAVSSSRISGGYLLAIGGSSVRWLYRYICVYIERQSRKERCRRGAREEEIGGKVTRREEDGCAFSLFLSGYIVSWGRRWEVYRKKDDRQRKREGKREKEREKKAEDEGTLGYKLSGDDSIAYRPLGSPEEVFRVLLRYTILYEERSYEGVQVTNTPQLCQLELVVVQLFWT